jgi:hypothetical protein
MERSIMRSAGSTALLASQRMSLIEGEWRPLKQANCIPKQAYNEKTIHPYLLVVTWRRLHNARLFEQLLYALRFV